MVKDSWHCQKQSNFWKIS